MSFKFFSTPNKMVFANENEQALVESLIELGKYKLYNIHKSNNTGSLLGGHVIAGRNAMFSGMDENFDYSKNNELVLEKLLKYSATSAGIANDPEILKSPRIRQNPMFSNKFFGVISQALPSIITATVNYMFMTVADTRNVGWGDNYHFKVNSKDIFTVNRIGKGVKRGAIQRLYSEDIVVTPEFKEVTVGMDWYQIVSLRYDIGDWLYRVGLSFTTDITTRVYKDIDDSFATLPTPLQIAGAFTDTSFIRLASRVKAANGNLPVSVMGTLESLSQVLPSNDYLKVELGGEYASVGYLGRYKGINLLEVPQVLKPGTVNTTLDFAIDNTRLYFFSMDADKPVKIVFEGEAITKEEDGMQTADGQIVVTIQNSYATKVASASVYGIMDM